MYSHTGCMAPANTATMPHAVLAHKGCGSCNGQYTKVEIFSAGEHPLGHLKEHSFNAPRYLDMQLCAGMYLKLQSTLRRCGRTTNSPYTVFHTEGGELGFPTPKLKFPPSSFAGFHHILVLLSHPKSIMSPTLASQKS